MSGRLLDWSELTDSRELLEARPPRTMTWTMGIILLVLAVGAGWCIFGRIDVVVKAPGVVRSNESAVKIVNRVAGSVEIINFQSGQHVEKDQILYEMNQEEWQANHVRLIEQLRRKREELKQLSAFQQQLRAGKPDAMSEGLPVEELLSGSSLEVDKLKLSLWNVRAKREQNDRLVEQLDRLKQSIVEGANRLSRDDEMYYRYENFRQRKEQLELQATSLTDAIRVVLRGGNEAQIEEAKRNLDNAKLAVHSAESDFQYAVVSELLAARQAQSEYRDKESELLIQLADTIEAADKAVKDLEYQRLTLDQEQDNRVVKAPISGTVSVVTEFGQGEFVQAGTQMLTIVPENGSEMTMQIAVANRDIARIRKGTPVKYGINALPSSEYGMLRGHVVGMNPDATVDSVTGMSYYVVQGAIDGLSLTNAKGESAAIKVGMAAEASIVTDRKNIGRWLLEKLDLAG